MCRVAAGSPWARATASAATVLSSALFGDTLPDGQPARAARADRDRGGVAAPVAAVSAASRAAEGGITAVAAKPAAGEVCLVVGGVGHGQGGAGASRRRSPWARSCPRARWLSQGAISSGGVMLW